MMPSDWKRKNKFMTFSTGQIKGMIAFCLILAIFPFIHYYNLFLSHEIPFFIDQTDNSLAIEIMAGSQQKGVYFVSAETSFGQLLKDAGIGVMFSSPDFNLKNGMKINIDAEAGNQNIDVTEMDGAKRLALGMPLNVNQASKEELLLIKGIGETTAEAILDLRKKLGRIKSVDQLMEIRGIKEKKLEQIRKHLTIGKNNQ